MEWSSLTPQTVPLPSSPPCQSQPLGSRPVQAMARGVLKFTATLH